MQAAAAFLTLLPDFCLLKSRRIESSRVGPSATHCAYDGGLVKPSRHVAISLHSNGITVYRRHAQVSDRALISNPGHYACCALKRDDAYVTNPLPSGRRHHVFSRTNLSIAHAPACRGSSASSAGPDLPSVSHSSCGTAAPAVHAPRIRSDTLRRRLRRDQTIARTLRAPRASPRSARLYVPPS